MKFIIAPSILAADFSKLGDEIRKIEIFDGSWVHLDIMDNHFVPNLTFGPCVVRGIRKLTDRFFDAHLMIDNPETLLKPFSEIPVQSITFHYEAVKFPFKMIDAIKGRNLKVGISISPGTPFDSLLPFLDSIDMVLIMSVEPGFAGQKFMNSALEKIEAASTIRKQKNLNFLIQVDGGINDTNLEKVIGLGADVVVLGKYFFESDVSVLKSVISRLRDV